MDVGALYGFWNRAGSLGTSHHKFDSAKWKLIKTTVDELVRTKMVVRKDAIKAIGDPSSSASVQITKVLHQRAQESHQEVVVSQDASESSAENQPQQEQHRHRPCPSDCDNME
ncbi:unnamed protein product [Absidia cylindrospora]